jgi:hypothetical protein
MAMVDVLGHMKEKALNEINPHLMTIATLTGHAVMAVGPYTAVMDNGAAKKESFAINLQATGDLYGDMFEVSTIRKEDYEFIKDKSGEFVDVLQVHLIIIYFFNRNFHSISYDIDLPTLITLLRVPYLCHFGSTSFVLPIRPKNRYS